MNKRMTLIENLEKELAVNCRLNNWDLGFKEAINIVKEHNDWVSVDDVNTTFKVGDKVYVGLTGRVAKVTEIIDDEVVSVANENNKIRVWTTNICHATQENYEMLSKLYQHIEIELPTKQLMNGNLCRAVLKK